MTEEIKPIVLPPAASKALTAFAERIGQDPQELAAEAIERFIAEEEPIADAILEGLEDVRNGRTVSHEEILADLDRLIRSADRKRA